MPRLPGSRTVQIKWRRFKILTIFKVFFGLEPFCTIRYYYMSIIFKYLLVMTINNWLSSQSGLTWYCFARLGGEALCFLVTFSLLLHHCQALSQDFQTEGVENWSIYRGIYGTFLNKQEEQGRCFFSTRCIFIFSVEVPIYYYMNYYKWRHLIKRNNK